MKRPARVGDSCQITFVVDASHVIDFSNDRLPAVLSTPRLIGILERAARQALSPILDDDETSLGVHVDIRHLAPTPLGASVECRARVIHVDGRAVTFQVEAFDDRERIARGTHKRSIVQVDRFARLVQRKQNPS